MSTIPLITAETLHARMNDGKDVWILDVRNTEEYAGWKIDGKTVRSINIPYFDFLEEDEASFKDLPREEEMTVVCAKGGSAMFVAELLAEKGFKSSVLDGGMLAWSQFYHAATVARDERVELLQINRLSKGCLSYAVISEGKAMIVDPSRQIEFYMALAEQRGFKIEHIVDSHLHADHISGGPELASATGATYYISSGEAQGTHLPFEPLENHGTIRFGQAEVEVLAIPTPGHTPGSTSFLLNNKLLMSGDTIFVGGLGRPDLGGKAKEWAEDLYHTVFTKIDALSDDVKVLPAHYADASEIGADGIVGAALGQIRQNNEIMQNADRDIFIEQAADAASSEKPPNFEEIVAINRGELRVEPERAAELEIGPNRCAIHHH
ncbi:MBL fold metallo-hydrolase [Paenibacillus sp. MBLB4367]|uniref:MBL fold metallo-hydrolase n=1 Tax=Paenibacillus sp. MBLB4367 TaxID=3384767 RepID=UPI003907FB77